MNMYNISADLLKQKIGNGEVNYTFMEGTVYDHSRQTNLITSTTNSVLASTAITEFTSSESWIKWSDETVPDLMVKIPGYVTGHKVLMLGAISTSENGRQSEVKNLAIFNMNSKKGHLCYKTITNPNAKDHHDCDFLSGRCPTKRDVFFLKFFMVGLPISGLIIAIASYFGTKSVIKSILYGFLMMFIGAAIGNNFVGQSRLMIVARVAEIAKMLKCDFAHKLK